MPEVDLGLIKTTLQSQILSTSCQIKSQQCTCFFQPSSPQRYLSESHRHHRSKQQSYLTAASEDEIP